ncbi:MAG: cytochrome P460 family protein [Gemmatimonadaceae bacterium]
MRAAKYLAVLPIVVCLAFTSKAARDPDGVPFPEGYRSWVHISSAVDTSGPRGAGMHHIYANPQAMEGYRSGKFPNGSFIVFDRLNVNVNGATTKASGRQLIDVMMRDTARFRDTGGWGFDEFVGDSRTQHAFPQSSAPTSCFNCHAQRKANDFVFTSFPDADRMAR